MPTTIDSPAGGYRYIPGVFQYSAGVRALDGYRIERVEFISPLPLAAGFAFIEQYLPRQGLPLVAFCFAMSTYSRSLERDLDRSRQR